MDCHLRRQMLKAHEASSSYVLDFEVAAAAVPQLLVGLSHKDFVDQIGSASGFIAKPVERYIANHENTAVNLRK